MIKCLKYLWQLPQNLLGLIVVAVTKAKKENDYFVTTKHCDVSLGNYIIVCEFLVYFEESVKHEKGHQKQSLYLGPLYLLTIGLLSFIYNLYDRIFHRKWEAKRRYLAYHNKFWEKWADKLGHVGISAVLEKL